MVNASGAHQRKTRLGEQKPSATFASLQVFERNYVMLSWAITFLIVALIAGVLGFGVIAGTAATIAKICFFVFIVLFLVSLLTGRSGAVV